VTKAVEHRYFDEIRTRCSNAAEKVRLLMVRRVKRKTKKTNTKCAQVFLDTADWPLAFEFDGDFRCGGDTWISDR
jgi:hypothetical protein